MEAEYSINTAQNQQILNSTYSGEMNLQLPKGIYFSANLNYQTYHEHFSLIKNYQFGCCRVEAIWEKKRAEVLLPDIFYKIREYLKTRRKISFLPEPWLSISCSVLRTICR
jgi:hypothetical protein